MTVPVSPVAEPPAPLARVEDLDGAEDFTPAQAVAAARAIDRASVAVRGYCRQAFTLTEHVGARIRVRDQSIRLPQRPVVSIESVALIVAGQPTVITGWLFDGLDRVWVGGAATVINLPEAVYEAAALAPMVALVSYTAGYEQVPADVAAVVAGIAGRALAVPAGGALSQQAAGPFSYTVASWATGGPLALSDADKAVLNGYRAKARSVETR